MFYKMITEASNDQLKIMEKYWNELSIKFGIWKFYKYLQDKEKDSGITYKMVEKFLKQQEDYQLNTGTRKTKHIRPIISKRPFNIIQIDLMDFSQGVSSAPKANKYLMVIIDVFSRYCNKMYRFFKILFKSLCIFKKL